MYKLEDRILFDGAAVADVADAQQEADSQQQEAAESTEAADSKESAHQESAKDADNSNSSDSSDGSQNDDSSAAGDPDDPGSLESVLAAIETSNTGSDGQHVDVLVVSDSLENAEDIVNATSSDTIVVKYDARTTSAADLLQQITDALGGKLADSIGFATESGENAKVQLFADADTSLDTVNNSVNQDFFHSLNGLMDEGAQLNLFASNLASTTEGEALVDAISNAVDHDVAASIDETGAESAGGDWDLEYSTNGVEIDASDVYLDENMVDNFDSLLEDHVNHEVAFINSSVMNVDEILNDLDKNVEVVMLEVGTDGLDQITDYLNEHSDVKYDAVHILTHGNEGYFVLNGQVVDGDYVSQNASDFVQWRNALSDDADIMIYGCNLTGSMDGESLVANIASLTGADVAASTDTVGGNDWSLDYNVGDINYGAFDINNYDYHLADQLVTSLADDGGGALLTLREAIAAVGTGQSITFDSSLSGTLTLAGANELSITKSMSITGLVSSGTNIITIDASSASRIFNITDGTVNIESLILTGGSATDGGAISNAGTLTLNNVDFTSNAAAVSDSIDVAARGGAIYNTGTLTILDSTFTTNTAGATSTGGDADAWGGAIYNDGGFVDISSSTFTSNSVSSTATGTATANGGAIYNAAGGYFILSEESSIVGDGATSTATFGGGIYNASGAAMSIETGTTIDSNVAVTRGGGIYNNGFLSISGESVITTNSAPDGGGIYNTSNGNIYIDKAKIDTNAASNDGGGIYNLGGQIQAENLWMTANTAGGDGAGIYNEAATATVGEITLQDSTLDNNTATGNGGAIYNQGKIYGENLTLAKNTATEGSAIYVDSQTPSTPGEFITATTLFNATIALNTTSPADPTYGFSIYRTASANDSLYINSSLFAGNYNGTTYHNVTGSFTDINNYRGGDAGDTATGFFTDAAPVDHGGWVPTLALNTSNTTIQNSIINKGSNDGPTIYDARGYMRNGTRDIGAYESSAYMAHNVDRNLYYTSVQSAIDAALSGEEIETFGTRYYLTTELSIGNDLIFTGQGKDVTVFDAQTLYSTAAVSNRLLTVYDAADTIFVRVDGMTFRNGGGVAAGGAILNYENLLLENVSIYGSTSTASGGAIHNEGGYLYIDRSEIYNNSITSAPMYGGGAIYNNLGKVRITESSLYGNTVSGTNAYGGAISVRDDGTGAATLTIISSALYDNTVTGTTESAGGAIYSSTLGAEQVEIINSTFAHNTAEYGGAMNFDGSGTYKFTNITVAYNETSDSTSYAVDFYNSGTVYSVNSLFLANYTGGVQSLDDFNDQNASVSYSIFNSSGNSSSTGYFADTRITDHGGWSKTIALASGSSAINSGTNIGVPNYDQRGYDTNSTRDRGAYEYNGIVAYYWNADAASPFWTGTSTITAATTARTSSTDTSEHVVKLVNTRILESNITVTTWINGDSGNKIARTVSIYGDQEGGTVIDAGYKNQIFNIYGTSYTSGTSTTYVMGTTNIERLTMTNGFTTGNGGAFNTTHASDGGIINVRDSSITNNIALGEGGAIYSHGADAGYGDKKDATYNVNNSLVAYNIAGGSGGAASIVKAANFTTSTLAYNRSFGSGGAIMVNADGAGAINNSTVSRNFASTNGGGIYLANGYTIGNTILAKNRTAGVISASSSSSSYDPDYESGYDYFWEDGTLSNGGYNLVEYQNGYWIKTDATNFFGPKSDSTGEITNGDILGPKAYLFSDQYASDHGGWSYTMELAQNSAALDKGSGSSADQRGYGVNRAKDIGAYELNGIVATVNGQSYSTIAEAIAAAPADDTISLVGSRINEHDLVIGQNMTIQTDSSDSYYSLALIDAQHYGRVFAIESSTVTASLANMILANSTILVGSGQGGQQAAGNGGAIFSAGTISLSEVSIANSFAQLSGGAIYSTKSLSISTSGINETGSSVTSTRGAYLARNSAQSNGGAIYASNTLSLTGGSSNNRLHLDYNYANAGGAIYASSIVNPDSGSTISSVSFTGNNATTRGGSIYLLANSAISIESSEFSYNSAMRYGGAVYTEITDALTFKNVNIQNNFAFSHGGGIYYNGLSNSNADLIIYSSSQSVEIINNQSLEGSGGAVYIENANQFRTYSETVTADMNYGYNNAAVSGGAIFATNIASGGGYAISIGQSRLADSINNAADFYYNNAKENGGAIYLENSGSFYASENVSMWNNIAGRNPYSTSQWTGEGKGGAVYVINSGDFIYMNNGKVFTNTARNFGGAFYIENSGFIDISYTEVADNASGEYYLGSSNWLTVADGTVTGAGQGGAFYFKENGNITLTDMDFYDNHARAEGGAVYIENGTNEDRCITINTSSFDRNIIDGTTTAYGGALYVDNAKAFNIVNSSFAFNDNTALYLGYGNLSLNFTTFAYNTNSAGTTGSTDALGIYLVGATGKTSAFVVNNSILHDGASTAGYRFGGDVTITAGQSNNNIFTYFNNFAGTTSGLSDGASGSVTAYLPYGDTTSASTVRDSYLNLVGTDSATSTFINNNLYLSTDMDYTGGRRTRTLALQSVNSIANRYSMDGGTTVTYAGNVADTASYDRDGTFTMGQMLIDNLAEVTGWSSYSGGTGEYQASADQEPVSVYAAGLLLTKNTTDIDALAAGEWAWDSTNSKIVVRLADDADPSSIAMTTQSDKNDTIIYDQRGNMRSGVTVDTSNTATQTSWSTYSSDDNEYSASSSYTVTNVSATGLSLTQAADIASLNDNQWAWDADNNTVVIKLASGAVPGDYDISLTTSQTTYTYYTYGELAGTTGDTWMKVVVAESGTTTTAASASDVHAGLGAFKANLYMTVTSNADNDYNPRYRYNYAEFSYMNDALASGVTLREAVYWIDTYDLTDLTVTGVTGNVKFDADRYVKFADSMFTDGNNTITLTAANNSSIIMDSDVVIGMVYQYGNGTTPYSYTDSGSTTHYFENDNSFLAQNDSSRITINGGGTDRIFDNSYHTDHSIQSGHWSVASTLGINNLTLTNGYVEDAMTYTSYNGQGGAIYNGYYWDSIDSISFRNTMYLNNAVVQNSTASNSGTSGSSDMGQGGGIYNAGTITIQDSTISGNLADGSSGTAPSSAGLGGGIYNSGTLTVRRSLISDNHVKAIVSTATAASDNSGTGGGIFSAGTLNLYSSTLSGNYMDAGTSQTVDGAALTVWSGTANIYGNTISYNKAYDGTGQDPAASHDRPGYAVYLRSGTSRIRNNIFAQNYIDGDTSQNRRDIIVSSSVNLTDSYNIVGSYYQASGYYDFAVNVGTTKDILGFNASGLVTDLNMDSDLLYNGGMTQNYRIQTASRAIIDPSLTIYSGTGIDYDQRNAVVNTDFGSVRTTIGAYELITKISIDSDVADAALPAAGIAYDYANDRGGWTVNLRNALYLADQGATVTVDVSGTEDTFTLVAGELLIFNGITLTTSEATDTLIIDAGDTSRHFAITDPSSASAISVTLEHLKLINGDVAITDRGGLGGAIYTTEGLTLNDVTIQDVTAASHGGAIYSLAGGLTLTDVTITSATSTNGDGGAINQQTDAFTATNLNISGSAAGGSGGAIYITDGSTFSLTGTSTIHDNTSGAYGGGIYFRGGDMTITDAYVYNNDAASDKDGGGLYVNSSGNITITTSTFGNDTAAYSTSNDGNTAARGAGIFVYAGSLEMVNSTISGNTATKDGGGLYFDGTALSLTYVTIANNYAGTSYSGGGVYMRNGSLTMVNSVIAQNYAGTTVSSTPSDFYLGTSASVTSATYSAIGQSNHDFSGGGNIVGTSGVIADLNMDTSLYNNGGNTPTLYVMSNSTLVGAGNAIAVTTSQNGRTRANPPTMGAFEGGSTTYYYVGDNITPGLLVTDEAAWNTAADGSGTALASGGFADADNLYTFTSSYVADLSTGTWTISDRSFVTIAAAGAFTVSGDAVVKAFVHRTPTTVANMTISASDTGNLTFNTANTLYVTLSELGSNSNVNYIYAGDQTVYTATYGNLTISGSGTKTADGAITVSGDLTNGSTFSSTYDLSVTGDTSGAGNITGANIYLNGTGNSLSGDLTASTGTVTFAGGTTTGAITAVTVNAEGTVGDVTATTLNSTTALTTTGTVAATTVNATGSLSLTSGSVTSTDLTATTLNMSGSSSVTTTNAALTNVNSTGGSNTLTVTGAEANVNYSSWVIGANGSSTLAIDRGTYDIQISEGSVTPSFNITNMTVASDSTVKFITSGDATLTNVDSTSLAGTYDGTLWIKCYDISMPGSDFSGGNMSLVIENSGYFNLVAGTPLTFKNSITINNVKLISGPGDTATLASTNGNVTIGNVISDSSTYSIILNANNGSTTIGSATGISNINMNSNSTSGTATVNGVVDISGYFSTAAATTDINYNLTTGSYVQIFGNLDLAANIAATGDVSVAAWINPGTTTISGTGDTSITGNTLNLRAVNGTGTGTLTLASNSTTTDSFLNGINISGNLTLSNGSFDSGSGAIASNSLNVASGVSLSMGSNAITVATNVINDGTLASSSTVTATSGSISNSGTFNTGAISAGTDIVNNSGANSFIAGITTAGGNITNTSGTFNVTSAAAGGNITNTSGTLTATTATAGTYLTNAGTMTLGTANVATDLSNTGSMTINTALNLTGTGASTLSLGGTVDLSTATLTLAADKNASLTNGDVTLGNFTFTADATPTSIFTLASGTNLNVTGTLTYNDGGLYTGSYFDTSGGGTLTRTAGTGVLYRVGNNSGNVAAISLTSDGTPGSISVNVADSIKVGNTVVTGIQDTSGFTTNISGYTGNINSAAFNWDNALNGTGFNNPGPVSLFEFGSAWTVGETVSVTTPSAGRSQIITALPFSSGVFAVANTSADMTIPITNLNGNDALYEMSNPNWGSYNSLDLDVANLTNFPIGQYPYFSASVYPMESSVGQAVYDNMAYRLVTDPFTNLLGGQVPPIGSIVGQAITEGASLTLTADAPVYLEVNGEYSIGAGWLPIGTPASAENIEQYQAPITQGQLDEFYLDFGGRGDIFETPPSFRSDLDEMLDDLLAG